MLAEYEINRESDERLFCLDTIDGVCVPHFHRKIEIMYVLEGEKKINVSDKEYIMHKNQILVTNSYQMHGYMKSENSKQHIIVIPNHMLRDYYLLYGNTDLKENFITDEKVALELKPIIEKIIKKEGNPLIVRGNIDLLLGKLIEILGTEKKEVVYNQKFIEDVLSYINEHYKENITLENLAAHFGYSKYYFSRMFNSVLDSNLTNYLTIVRLQGAIESLKEGKKTVAEAAFENGFASIATFYRALKKNYAYKKVDDLLKDNKYE